MANLNSSIITQAWLDGSNDFQQRIPNPSIAGYQACVNALFDPLNGQYFNEFANMLVGMMGTYVESKRFDNPLRELKKPATQFGATERHVAIKYLKAHSPKVDDETLLKLEKPEFVEWFYSVNQNRRYEFSWSRYELMRVFSQADSYGYDDLLAGTLSQQMSSDSYDEMTSMIQAFAVADNNEKFTLYRHHISGAPTTKELGQELLVAIKTDAGQMQFPTRRFNQIDVPVFETPKTLVLWVTPEVDAQLDVFALAELFHVDKAEVNFRKIVIPEFPIPNVYCALTSEDFIYCRDVYYGVEPPFYNQANRTYKYYLYHDQMMGVNPCANCVLYTTDAQTDNGTISINVTDFRRNINVKSPELYLGDSYNLNKLVILDGSVMPDGTPIKIEPQGAVYEIGEITDTATRYVVGNKNSRTYISKDGILHIQKTPFTLFDEQTVKPSTIVARVKCSSPYVNPSISTSDLSLNIGDLEITINNTPRPDSEGAKESFVSENPNLVYTSDGNEVSYSKSE